MNRNAHILGLMSIAFAAFGLSIGTEVRTTLIAAGLLAAAAIASVVFEQRAAATTPAAAVAGAPVPVRRSTVQTKRMLMLMMAIGIVVYGGGAGTFSSFSAETSNTNNSIASGTLTMTDTANGSTATACASMSSLTQDNVNELPSGQNLNQTSGTKPTSGSSSLGGCDVALTLSNAAPGVYAGEAKIAIQNTGSLDASKFWFFAPYVNTALNTAAGATIAANASLSTITVLPIEGPITQGDTIELDYNGHSQTLTAGAPTGGGTVYSPLSTSINLSGSPTADIAYPVGTRVLDKSTDGKTASHVPQNTDCFDVRNTASINGGTAGTALNFNYNNATVSNENATTHWVTSATNTYTGPLCSSLGFWIQEQSTVNGQTYNYCWYGSGASSTSGMCNAPISAAFPGSGTQSITGSTTYTISTAANLTGNVASGDAIWVTEPGHATAYCTATQNEYINSPTLVFNNCTSDSAGTTPIATAYSFDISSTTIIDESTISALANDTQTLSNFDTLDGPTSKQELAPLVANGTLANTGANVSSIELGHAGSAGTYNATTLVGTAPNTRTFYLGVFMPSSAGNPLQGLKSTFGIGWHIDQ